MSTTCDQVTDDLSLLVEGDRDAIDRHAEHLASCDACRDARHEATQLAKLVGSAGSDFVPRADLEARLLATVDAKPAEKPVEKVAPAPVVVAPAAQKVEAKKVEAKPATKAEARPVTPIASKRKTWLAV